MFLNEEKGFGDENGSGVGCAVCIVIILEPINPDWSDRFKRNNMGLKSSNTN